MNCPYVMRRCKECGEIKFLFKFAKNKNSKYGFRKECKQCKTEREKKYYKEHKDNRLEYGKEYYKKNKEEMVKKNKQYYEENKEEIAERSKQYYKDNKEERAEYQKKYLQSEKGREKHRKYNRSEKGQVAQFNRHNRRRSKEQNQGNGITKEQWLEMMNFFNWKCAYSDMRIDKNNRSIDHIIALDNGGLNEIWNCVPMYKPYNSSKKTSDMLEWYQKQDFYSEERLQKIYEWQEYAYNKWGKEGEACLH